MRRWSIVVTLVLGAAALSLAAAVQTVTPLSAAVPRLAPGKLALMNGIGVLFSRSGIPGGVAAVETCKPPKFVELPPGDSTLGASLATILSHVPGYKVGVSGGVVNVLPAAGVPPLLQTVIAQFDFSGSGQNAFSKLEGSPEVRSAEIRLGIREFSFGGLSGSPQSSPKRLQVRLRGASLLDGFNEIVRLQGNGFWQFSELRCGSHDQVTMRLETPLAHGSGQ